MLIHQRWRCYALDSVHNHMQRTSLDALVVPHDLAARREEDLQEMLYSRNHTMCLPSGDAHRLCKIDT